MNPYYDANVLYDAGDHAMKGSQFKYASKLYKLNQLLITAKLQKALQNGTYHPKGSMSSDIVSEERNASFPAS